MERRPAPGPPAAWRGRAAVLALELLFLGLVSRRELPPRGFPLDDSWIHQTVARVFAETGTLGFEPGAHGAAASSWLWALLLSLNPLALHLPVPAYTVALGAALYLGTGVLLHDALRDDGLGEGTAVALAAAFSAAGNYVWFAVSGMEASLVAFLSVAAIRAWFRPWEGPRAPAAAGALLALLFFSRPECLALGPVLALLRRRPLRELALAAAGPALAFTVYAALNLLHTGHVEPPTFTGRRWLWLLPFAGFPRGELLFVVGAGWVDRLAEWTLGTVRPWVFFVAFAFAIRGAGAAIRGLPRARALLAWTLVHTATYAVLLPTMGHGGRYQPLLPAVFALLVALGLGGAAADVARLAGAAPPLRRLVAGAAGLPLAVGLVTCLHTWGRVHSEAVSHVENTEVAMGRALATLPPGARVASFDIGGIGYFADRRVEELGGLVSPEIVPLLERGRISEWLARVGAEYVVVPLDLRLDSEDVSNFARVLGLLQAPELELTRVIDFASPFAAFADSSRATMHCAPRQRMYRIRYREPRP